MKFILSVVALVLFTTNFAHAENKFEMSKNLKLRVMNAAYSKCQLETALIVKVESISVLREKIDQGSFDKYYTVVLNAAVENEKNEIINKKVIVKAAEYDISNPAFDRYEIFSVESPSVNFCN